MSHLGDPHGAAPYLNLNRVKQKLEDFGISLNKADDSIGSEVKEMVLHMKEGEILLLENLRFHKEEKENNPEFAKELSGLGELFVNDAFAECHRAYASITGIPKFLPSCQGLLLEKEISSLNRILTNPERPFVAIVGGAKAETKVKFIDKISEVADTVIIAGFIQQEAMEENIKFQFSEKMISPVNAPDNLDISAETLQLFLPKILEAKTILWNGPFGKIEDKAYRNGTLEIANAIVESGAFSVVGGGSTVEFLQEESLMSKFSHVSTGGGAMLEFLSGETLPGLKALQENVL